MRNCLQINPFTINELSPNGFIAERWEFHENKRVGNKIKIPFSFLGLKVGEVGQTRVGK